MRDWQQMQGHRMLDKLSEAAGPKITFAGASVSTGSGLWGWLGDNHGELAAVGVLIGIAVGIFGLVIQVIFHRRRERREIESHNAKMAKLRGRDGP